MFLLGKREMDSKEYKQVNSDLLKLEKAMASLEIEVGKLQQQFQKFQGRFYQHLGKEGENESEEEKALNNAFLPFKT